MEWIIKNIDGGIKGQKKISINIDFPFSYFIDSMNLISWSDFIDLTSREDGYNIEGVVEIIYSQNLDWHDINILKINLSDDMVMARFLLQTPYTEAVMNKIEFKKMLIYFSNALLKIHKDDDYLPNDWSEKMEKAIKNLELKVM